MSEPQDKWRSARSGRLLRGVVFLLALAVIVGVGVLSYAGIPDSKQKPPPVVLAVLLVALVALLLPEVRQVLGRVTTLKAGGFEVSISAITKTADEDIRPLTAVQPVPSDAGADLEEESDDQWEPRVVESVEAAGAAAALDQLNERLIERIEWIRDNLPGRSAQPRRPLLAIESLRRDGLISSAHAELLKAVAGVSSKSLEATDPLLVERFLRQADAVVHTLRLIALDRLVRGIARNAGYVIVDWHPQPRPQRWPDFLIQGEGPMATESARGTWWISVRPAIKKESELYDNTLRRLSSERWRSEVPGGAELTALIVVPDKSQNPLAGGDRVEGVKVSDLVARLTA